MGNGNRYLVFGAEECRQVLSCIYRPVLAAGATETYTQVLKPAGHIVFHIDSYQRVYVLQKFVHARFALQEVFYRIIITTQVFVIFVPA